MSVFSGSCDRILWIRFAEIYFIPSSYDRGYPPDDTYRSGSSLLNSQHPQWFTKKRTKPFQLQVRICFRFTTIRVKKFSMNTVWLRVKLCKADNYHTHIYTTVNTNCNFSTLLSGGILSGVTISLSVKELLMSLYLGISNVCSSLITLQ